MSLYKVRSITEPDVRDVLLDENTERLLQERRDIIEIAIIVHIGGDYRFKMLGVKARLSAVHFFEVNN